MSQVFEICTYDLDWHVIHWKWLNRNLKSRFDLDRIKLVAPTPRIFPVVNGTADQKAAAIFRGVQKHFGLEKLSCRLEPFEKADDIVREVAGTKTDEILIHYKPSQLDDPMALVTTMAHGLSRYVIATIKETPPLGWRWSMAIADLTTVFFGFGIFLANSVFHFSQSEENQYQAWTVYRRGGLPENSLMLGLAIFCTSKKLSLEPSLVHLGSNSKVCFKAYCKELLKHHRKIVSQLPTATRGTNRAGFSCPHCRAASPIGRFWRCETCGMLFDTFETQAKCPSCSEEFATTACVACERCFPMSQWRMSGGKGQDRETSRGKSKEHNDTKDAF